MNLTEKEILKATNNIIKYSNALRRLTLIGAINREKHIEKHTFAVLKLTTKIKQNAAFLSGREVFNGCTYTVDPIERRGEQNTL